MKQYIIGGVVFICSVLLGGLFLWMYDAYTLDDMLHVTSQFGGNTLTIDQIHPRVGSFVLVERFSPVTSNETLGVSEYLYPRLYQRVQIPLLTIDDGRPPAPEDVPVAPMAKGDMIIITLLEDKGTIGVYEGLEIEETETTLIFGRQVKRIIPIL